MSISRSPFSKENDFFKMKQSIDLGEKMKMFGENLSKIQYSIDALELYEAFLPQLTAAQLHILQSYIVDEVSFRAQNFKEDQ